MKVIKFLLLILIVSFSSKLSSMNLSSIQEAINEIEDNRIKFSSLNSLIVSAVNKADFDWFKDELPVLLKKHPDLVNQKFTFKAVRKKYIKGKVTPLLVNYVLQDLNLYSFCFAKMIEAKIFQKNSEMYCKFVEILALLCEIRDLDKLREDAYTTNLIKSYYDNYPQINKHLRLNVRNKPEGVQEELPKKYKLNEYGNLVSIY